jgi:hypothetical protein
MKLFSKSEFFGLLIIYSVVFILMAINLRVSIRKARDSQRMTDLGIISDGLHRLYSDYGFFPPSEDGKIKFCKNENFDKVLEDMRSTNKFDRNKLIGGLRPCKWGEDSLDDLLNDESQPYIQNIPSDPKTDKGMSYYYISDQEYFQVYASLEGGANDEYYDSSIVARNLKCGNSICSFGKSYASLPLDISIEKYRQTLIDNKNSTGK